MNFTSLSQIKNRLILIIDQVLNQFDSSLQYGLDESKLQEWADLLGLLVVQKKNVIQGINNQNQIQKDKYEKIGLPKISSKNQFQCSKIVEILNSQKLNVHSYDLNKSKVVTKSFSFPENTFKKFCSISQITFSKFVFAGGCTFTNPFQKSSTISIFDTQENKIQKVSKLPQKISSHFSIFISPHIYFVGGKKHNGIITKSCYNFNIFTKTVNQIAALNYGASSLCLISYKQKYIYKIGGLGECFQQFGISSYIQRYSIQQDFWEVINPDINQNILQKFNGFHLYVCSGGFQIQNGLVVFGGFDENKKTTNFGFILKIRDQQGKEQQQDDIHEIQKFGQVLGLQPGGFWDSQIIPIQINGKVNSIMMLQTVYESEISLKLNPIIISTL